MVAETHDMRIPDDLMTVPEIAKQLDRPYNTVKFHLKRAGLLRWERRATLLASLSEARAYFDRWESVRPVDEEEYSEEERT